MTRFNSKCVVGFLIDSFERSDEFKKEMNTINIRFRQHPHFDNVIIVRDADKKKVVKRAEKLGIAWQWTNIGEEE